MRDYRDAKAMAHTLRDTLAAKNHKITVGESLELVARLFGVADWNTLSAIIKNSDSAAFENSHRVPEPTSARHGPGHVEFAKSVEDALHRTLALAVNRGQDEATVLHMLCALTGDLDAAAVMKECKADPVAIREALFTSDEIGRPGDYETRGMQGDPTPTAAFQRVVQLAILDLQASGGGFMTGAHLLAAIFSAWEAGILSEQERAAVQILKEQGVNQKAVLRIINGRLGGRPTSPA